MKLGVCYYPEHWDNHSIKQNAKDMVALGIRIVRIGEFSWSLIEPEDGLYQWSWLDFSIEELGKCGLEIVLGTPTAAPPKWLIDKYPEILPYDINGQKRKFGSRRHYTFSSKVYLEECSRIVTKMVERYGKNPYVKYWQTDNEYGCHHSTLSYGKIDLQAFRIWLKKKYKTIQLLNEAWGCRFWSMNYNHFEQIELPNLTVAEASPTAWLDFYRFSSEQVILFNKTQVDIIRKYSKALVLHNYMLINLDSPYFDHYQLGEDLDIATWDSYPLGATIQSFWFDKKIKQKYLRTGDLDIVSFHHSLYRTVGKGRFWVMEQQPGPVNWAEYNVSPMDGMIRFWTMESFAHGAEVVSYFRWKQCPYAQEQFHSGLNLCNDELDQAQEEIQKVYQELKLVPKLQNPTAEVALIFDYESNWAIQSLPQGKDFKDPSCYCFEIYKVLRTLGINVDVIGSNHSFSKYKLVILVNSILENSSLLSHLENYKGVLLMMPRTSSKTRNLSVPLDLPVGILKKILDIKVKRVESLPPYIAETIQWENSKYNMVSWRESIEILDSNCQVLATFTGDYRKGEPAIIQKENIFYCAGFPDKNLYRNFFCYLLNICNIPFVKGLDENLRLVHRGSVTFAFNYSNQEILAPISEEVRFLIGNEKVQPFDFSVWHVD